MRGGVNLLEMAKSAMNITASNGSMVLMLTFGGEPLQLTDATRSMILKIHGAPKTSEQSLDVGFYPVTKALSAVTFGCA